MQKRQVLLSWSSGKDSAWTLHTLRQDPSIQVVGLLTTLNAEAERVAMHGVRRELLRAQGRAAGLPVTEVELPPTCTNDDYHRILRGVLAEAKASGVEAVAYGDLFLEDVRDFRVENMEGSGLEPLFPLWGRGTAELSREMTAGGLSAVLTCVDTKQLDARFLGRRYDGSLLDELPEGADPCGENGEFHSFVTAGPMFEAPLDVTTGEVVERGQFHFIDVLPKAAGAEVRA